MNTNEREKLMMAYLDGQMSATEASAFDESVSPVERERLAGETRLEAGIAEALRGPVTCPEALWRRTQQALREQGARRPRRRRWYWTSGTLAAAAVLAVVFLQFAGLPGREGLLTAPGSDLAAFAKTSQVPDDVSAVEAFLHRHGMNLKLAELAEVHPESHHAARLLGAREDRFGDEKVVSLLYECCGYPVKIVVAPESAPAGQAMKKALKTEGFQESLARGGNRLALVSTHPSPALLDVVQAAGPSA